MRPGVKTALILAAVGVVGFILWRIHPAEAAWMPQCPLLKYGGLYCSGCGSLRAVHYLLHGNLPAAWAMNPLTVLLLPGILYLAAAELLFRTHRPANRIRPAWLWMLLLIIVAFAVLRNLPFEPFGRLAPH